MRNLAAALGLAVALLMGGAGTSWAADLQKGWAAFEKGDGATALRELTPLAEQGDALAQAALELIYDKAQGVPQDYKAAARWYRLAAEQGLAWAQYHLGHMYEAGQGVPQDYKAAARWYRLAAEQGYAAAQNNLGAMYLNGEGVLQDNVRGHMWANIAAANGGSENASKNRDLAAKRMSPTAIESAQRLARECMARDYKGCRPCENSARVGEISKFS